MEVQNSQNSKIIEIIKPIEKLNIINDIKINLADSYGDGDKDGWPIPTDDTTDVLE